MDAGIGLYLARFNPRPRAGGDLLRSLPFEGIRKFQSTPPRGGRRWASCRLCVSCKFQSTPPRGGRPPNGLPIFAERQVFQSTPPRGGRPADDALAWLTPPVSIHAPARGATVSRPTLRFALKVSIHAPARGATPRIFHVARRVPVSIHAPARGATAERRPDRDHSCRFNPRPRAGGDGPGCHVTAGRVGFQSTPPRGGRPPPPQTHLPLDVVSIHAPARGATR